LFEVGGGVRGYEYIFVGWGGYRAGGGVVTPPRYQADLGAAGRTAVVQLIVDGSDPQSVGSATNTAGALVSARATQLLVGRLQRLGGGGSAVVPVEAEPSTWYNPDLRTAVFVVPGLVGVILTMTMVMLTAMAIARERERGTLEQLIVSPVRRLELIVGKIIPYVGMGYVQMTLILGAGAVIFDVPVVGSLPLLYTLAFLFIAANLTLGLFFSTLAATQQQAMQMSFFFLLPNILLSGFMFPFEAMPRPAQWLAEGLPLTHFLRIVRGITLKGSHFSDVSSQVLWLAGILGVLLLLTSLRFRKKLG
jgi:ABC-2 type transport system permease protein